MPLDMVHTHPSVLSWLPSSRRRSRVGSLLDRRVMIVAHRRADLATAWAASHGGGEPPSAYRYAFRAWSTHDASHLHILVDSTENRASVVWLVLQQLALREDRCLRLLDAVYRDLPAPLRQSSSPDAASARATYAATHAMPLMGHDVATYGRTWWTRRVRARLGGQFDQLHRTAFTPGPAPRPTSRVRTSQSP